MNNLCDKLSLENQNEQKNERDCTVQCKIGDIVSVYSATGNTYFGVFRGLRKIDGDTYLVINSIRTGKDDYILKNNVNSLKVL